MGVLHDYHEGLGELIFRYEGTLDRFAGDGIMIVFNDPIAYADHTERAVRLALGHAGPGGEAVRAVAAQGPHARIRCRHCRGLRHARANRLRAAS